MDMNCDHEEQFRIDDTVFCEDCGEILYIIETGGI